MFAAKLTAQATCPENELSRLRLAQDYAALFILPVLSPSQEQAIANILETASQDKKLDQMLSRVEWWCGLQLGLLDTEHCHAYENQKAYLREYLETDSTSFSQV